MQQPVAESHTPSWMPPRRLRSLQEALHAADKPWRELIQRIRDNQTVTPLMGAELFLALNNFIRELTTDEQLQKRLMQDFEARLQAMGPPSTGKLL